MRKLAVEKRCDLQNKRRVNRSRRSGSSKHGDDESVASASDAGHEAPAGAMVARWDFARKVATLDLEGATRTAYELFTANGRVIARFSIDGVKVEVPVIGVWWSLINMSDDADGPKVFRAIPVQDSFSRCLVCLLLS